MFFFFCGGGRRNPGTLGTHKIAGNVSKVIQAQARELAENAGDFARHFEPEDWQLVQEILPMIPLKIPWKILPLIFENPTVFGTYEATKIFGLLATYQDGWMILHV